MATDLNLFHCEAHHCDLQASACLVNQSRGALEGSLSVYYKCLTCPLGALLREANGGELPEVKFNNKGGIQVVGGDLSPQARHLRKEKPMGKHAVKINNELVNLLGGQPSTVSMPAAADKLAQALAPPDQLLQDMQQLPDQIAEIGKEVTKFCNKHPDREAHPGKSGLCHECLKAYQREWYRKKRQHLSSQPRTQEKPEENILPVTPSPEQQVRPVAPAHTPPETLQIPAWEKPPGTRGPEPPLSPSPAPVSALPEIKLCITCQVEPAEGKSSRCKTCLTKVLQAPGVQEKRVLNCGARTRKAHQVLKRFEAGELCEEFDRFKPVFDLVPGLEEHLQVAAVRAIRPLAAEMAFRLRQSMEAE